EAGRRRGEAGRPRRHRRRAAAARRPGRIARAEEGGRPAMTPHITDYSCPPRRPGVLIATPSLSTRATLGGRLETAGFNVWTAPDGLKAFDTFLRHTGEI